MDPQDRGTAQEFVDEHAVAGQPRPVLDRALEVLQILAVPAEFTMIAQIASALEPPNLPAAQLKPLLRAEKTAHRRGTIDQPRVCAALDAEYLTALRNSRLALPQWPLERRLYGPLSGRVDFLTATINLAEHLAARPDPGQRAVTLLQRYARNIPGCGDRPTFAQAAECGRDELRIHTDADTATRTAAGALARVHLDDTQQLFGGPALSLPDNPTDTDIEAALAGFKGVRPLAGDPAAAAPSAGDPGIGDAATGNDLGC